MNDRSRLGFGFGVVLAGAVVGVVLIAGCPGLGPPANGNGGPPSQTLTDFEQVWEDFSRNYSHFAVKGIDWDAVREWYRPDFVSELTVAQFVARLAPMLAELEDLHVNLFDADGEVVETYTRPAERNWLGNYLFEYFPWGGRYLKDKHPLWHAWMRQNIAYVSIETFDSDEWDPLYGWELDDLFELYADADGMIVDVRRNSGGAEDIAKAIAGHFTDESFVYGYTEDRIPGSDRDAFRDLAEHELQPAEHAPFLKPFVLLIGQKNMSSAEWFILMMMECPNLLFVVGDETRGSSGNPQEFSLANGVSYLIPTWNAYDAYLIPIEDVGIFPEDWIEPSDSYDDDLGVDYVIDAGFDWLIWWLSIL